MDEIKIEPNTELQDDFEIDVFLEIIISFA